MRAVSRIENFGSYTRTAGFLCLAILLGIGGAASELPATSSEKKSGDVFKNLKVLNNTPSDLLLPSMQFITSSLGVQCEYCHVENAFEKDDKKPKQIARQMIQMMEKINNTEFRDRQEVTCYSCHRGSPKPLTVPMIAGTPQRLLSEPVSDVPSGAQKQPSPADIASKYVSARGGANAIANMSSLEERGAFHSDSLEFPMEFFLTKTSPHNGVSHLFYF